MTTAKVYKIVNDINEEIYVGSTKSPLHKRFYMHKSDSKKDSMKHYKLYELANEYGWENFRIILIEEFECKNNEERLRKEQQYIDELKPTLNKKNAIGKCEHNKLKSACKDCGGSQICEHNRIRSYCKDCKGSSICEHNKEKRRCKDCGGGSICEHNKQRSQCKDCKGGSICEHNKYRNNCKDCSPAICEICNKTYSKGSYRRHMKQVHNN